MTLALGFFNLDTFVDPFIWIPVAICSAMNALPGQSASARPPGVQQEDL
jgi:hypothetical protein